MIKNFNEFVLNESYIFDSVEILIEHVTNYVENIDEKMQQYVKEINDSMENNKNDLIISYKIDEIVEKIEKDLKVISDFKEEVSKRESEYNYDDFDNFNKATQKTYETLENAVSTLSKIEDEITQYLEDLKNLSKGLKTNSELIKIATRKKFNMYYIS